MSLPSISVLITYYNEGAMLTETLTSLLQGRELPDEILIYDDFSAVQPQPFIPAGCTVRVLRGEANVGPGQGRNRLLEMARGDYIHFHDSDDWFHPDWCQFTKERLRENAVDVLFAEVSSSFTDRPDFSHPFMDYQKDPSLLDLTAIAIERALLVPCASIRRDSARRIGGFRSGLWQSEDKDFYIRLAASGVSWQVDDRTLICIRNRTDSRSKQLSEVYKDGLKCLEYARAELPPRYAKPIANAAAKYAYHLYILGETAAARQAFGLSREMGGASYAWRSGYFRWIARLLGAPTAEAVSLFLQNLKRRLPWASQV